jgi:hypothetical protein
MTEAIFRHIDGGAGSRHRRLRRTAYRAWTVLSALWLVLVLSGLWRTPVIFQIGDGFAAILFVALFPIITGFLAVWALFWIAFGFRRNPSGEIDYRIGALRIWWMLSLVWFVLGSVRWFSSMYDYSYLTRQISGDYQVVHFLLWPLAIGSPILFFYIAIAGVFWVANGWRAH